MGKGARIILLLAVCVSLILVTLFAILRYYIKKPGQVKVPMPSREGIATEEIEICGRTFTVPHEAAQESLVNTVLSALQTTHMCLGGINTNIGVATEIAESRTLVSLFDRDAQVQTIDPFNRSTYIFFVLDNVVYYKNQFDGSFFPLRDPAQEK